MVVDIDHGITKEDNDIFQQLGETKHIIVLNKIDTKRNITLPPNWENGVTVRVSALRGTNIDTLKETIYDMGVGRHSLPGRSSLVPNLRQAEGLKRAQKLVLGALKGNAFNRENDLTAMDLGDAVKELDKILGLSYTEDVLDLIFNRFCIGK